MVVYAVIPSVGRLSSVKCYHWYGLCRRNQRIGKDGDVTGGILPAMTLFTRCDRWGRGR